MSARTDAGLATVYHSPMTSTVGPLRLSAPLLAAAIAGGCGKAPRMDPVDGSISDGPVVGTQDNPARTCAALHAAGRPSDVYWLRDPQAQNPAFQVYCEQQLNGGGWAMVENSVRRDDGTTTTFWQFKYADRLTQLGTPAADQNYYDGALYLLGTEYMDVFVDLQDKTSVAAVMTATGINPTTMQFTTPHLTVGNSDVYVNQFAGGWSSQDFDGDPFAQNCAVQFANVAQHYGACWTYNLGADADLVIIDGGVGPHVNSATLSALGLSPQADGGVYSQVKRIARFARW